MKRNGQSDRESGKGMLKPPPKQFATSHVVRRHRF